MLGIDILNIKRFENFYQKYGKKGLKRFLNEDEIALSKEKIETLAGFFASKEAISKALGTGIGKELSFLDIILHKTANNAPYFTLPKNIVDKYSITKSSLSISHEKEYVIAVAYIEKNLQIGLPLFH